ncbi:hypothetical protein HZA42_05600 [Candidatus Peregrinibacteria bacterium]|nr:hypothetical protein [Candidatus Peregrinibacteria bacterium]
MWNPFAPNSQGVKISSQNANAATQLHLRIAEIRDNTVVLKSGGLRSVLKVSSMNFNLKSEAEQNAIIYSYQSFLNTLEFPVQIVIRSRKLDLDTYIDKLNKIAEKQTNSLLQKQTHEYVDYIQRLIEYADIMEKEFYVVVPMDPARVSSQNFVEKFWGRMHPADTIDSIVRRHKEFDQLKKNLNQRTATISSGLENCGLKVQELNTSELIALFYQIYNPITSRNEKIEDPEKAGINSEEDFGH